MLFIEFAISLLFYCFVAYLLLGIISNKKWFLVSYSVILILSVPILPVRNEFTLVFTGVGLIIGLLATFKFKKTKNYTIKDEITKSEDNSV